ncbi:MAG: hypothetical protein V9G20_20530 [Candidatus Promineifilaceae bacterium]
MYELNMGATVHCTDGQCGHLTKLVLEPDTYIVTHIVVEEGLLFKRARAFPISVVKRTAVQDIYLSISAEQMSNFPEYHEDIVERPDPVRGGETLLDAGPYMTVSSTPIIRQKVRQGIPADSTVIERGTVVQNPQGADGKLDSVVIEPESGQITQLVMHQGIIFTEQKLIPVANVRHIGERSIDLTT